MKTIDREYEGLGYNEDKVFPLQSKLSAYRKDIEVQMETEMNLKVQTHNKHGLFGHIVFLQVGSPQCCLFFFIFFCR